MNPDSPQGQNTDLSTLRTSSVRNGIIGFVAQILKLGINGVGMIAFARLLPPTEHGLIAIVLAITGFFAIFRDAGLPEATITRQDLSGAQLTNVFWMNFGLACVVALVLCALAPIVSWSYRDSRLLLVTLVLSIPFIISGAASQHVALLKRDMRFAQIATLEVLSTFLANGLGLTAAYLGAGYWSLVIVPLVLAASSAILAWTITGWIPGWPVRGVGVRQIVRFAGHITAFDIVNYFARNADKLLVGKMFGTAAVGIYAKAYQLFMLPLSQIKEPAVAVALPAMSRLRSEPEKYRAYYFRLLEILAFTSMPVAVTLYVCARPLILLLLGNLWEGVVPILQALAISGLLQSVETTRGVVMLSCGHSDRFLKYGIARSLYSVGSFTVGLHWGPLGVAWAYVIGGYVSLFPSLVYCFGGTPIKVVDFFRAIALPLVTSVISLIASSVALSHSHLNNSAQLIAGTLLIWSTYLLLLFASAAGRQLLKRVFGYVKFGIQGSRGLASSIAARLDPRRLIRTLAIGFHRTRMALVKSSFPLTEMGASLYTQSSDVELKAWVIQDERWSRVTHRSEHRRIIKNGGQVEVPDDIPSYIPSDFLLANGEINIVGQPTTTDEWFYMYLPAAKYSWTDYSWSFAIRRSSQFRELQFGVRYLDFYNRYRFRIENDFLFFDLVERGQFINALGRVPCVLPLDTWHSVRIDAVANSFSFWLDGKPLLRQIDFKNTFPYGSIAVILWDNSGKAPIQVSIREIAVIELRVPEKVEEDHK